MKALVVLILASLACAGLCDYDPTSIAWRQWKIESSEDLWAGRSHSSYPLTNLIDGDPATAWVFSGNWLLLSREERKQYSGNFSLTIRNGLEIPIDEIRIMNGYNKSPEVFAKNDRIKDIALFGWIPSAKDQRLLCTKTLTDEMGWHSIPFSPKRYESLTIKFVSRYPGTEHDLCISGIELYSKGKKIDWAQTKLLVRTDGSDCGCGSEYQLINQAGKVVDRCDAESIGGSCLGEDGRYAQIVNEDGCTIYDTIEGTRLIGPIEGGFDQNFEVKHGRLVTTGDSICVYDLLTKKEVFKCPATGEPRLLENGLIEVLSDTESRLYDMTSRKLLCALAKGNYAFSPDGRYYAESIDWQRHDYIKIYNLKTKHLVRKQQVRDTDNEIVWKDAKTVVSKTDSSVLVHMP